MKIGLDYGGVISFAPDGWTKTIKKAINNGHQIYIVSHVQPNQSDQMQLRETFSSQSGAINLAFWDLDWYTQKELAGRRKANLCNQHGIEIFIDDDATMCELVSKFCDRCAALYIPQNLWQVGQRLIDGLGNDDQW